MWGSELSRNLLYLVGASTFFHGGSEGVAITTVVLLSILAFWVGLAIGVALTLLAVSPSLRAFLRRSVLNLLLDEPPGRERLQRYRRD